jgi:glutamyl/glutaminyl-tRNA synthetase
MRYDDTNPKKSRQEYHDNIEKDVASLGVTPDIV